MLTLDMFATLAKVFCLPSYAGGLAQVFAKVPSPIPPYTDHYNRQELDFIDIEAI